MTLPIKIKVLPGGRLPVKATEGASGFDLFARIDHATPGASRDHDGWAVQVNVARVGARSSLAHRDPRTVFSHVVKVPLGVAFEIPPGYEGQIRARSSLGSKGLVIPNGLGTIDSDYRGEVAALYLNLSGEDFVIRDGDRVAQIVFQRVPDVTLVEADSLAPSVRGAGGFGSTGTGALASTFPTPCRYCNDTLVVMGNVCCHCCPGIAAPSQPDLFRSDGDEGAPLGDPDE